MTAMLLSQVSNGSQDGKIFSAQSFATGVSVGIQALVYDDDHDGMVRIFVAFLRAVLPVKVEVSTRAIAANGKTKALTTPPPR